MTNLKRAQRRAASRANAYLGLATLARMNAYHDAKLVQHLLPLIERGLSAAAIAERLDALLVRPRFSHLATWSAEQVITSIKRLGLVDAYVAARAVRPGRRPLAA